MEAKKISLLTGCYPALQAQEMLAKMIRHELQFQQLQNFTSLVRYEDDCEQASGNIHRLVGAGREVEQLAEAAKAEGLHLQVELSLMVQVVPQAAPERRLAKHPAV